MQPGPGKKGCRDFVRQCPPHNVPAKFSGSIVVLKILHEQARKGDWKEFDVSF